MLSKGKNFRPAKLVGALFHHGLVLHRLGDQDAAHRNVVLFFNPPVPKTSFEAGGALQYLPLRFTQALITQMTQTAVCNHHHSVDQQLCRWLLLSLDRLPANELVMTQELIANMPGVRREGVTEAAGKLQDGGMIE